MNTHLRFNGPLSFQRFLKDCVTRVPNWRNLMAQRVLPSDEFILEWPSDIAVPSSLGCTVERVGAVLQSDKFPELSFRLGETWKRARPIRRDERSQMAPSCFLVLVEGDLESATRRFVEQAPAGLEFVTLAIDYQRRHSVHAFLLLGDAGRMVAHSPPVGCTGYECDHLPGGGLAAFPVGWTTPSIAEHLWPPTNGQVILYSVDAASYTATIATIEIRLPLAHLLSCPAQPDRVLRDATAGMKPTPWRVVRRESVPADNHDWAEERGTTSVVFRLRTTDRAANTAGERSTAKGHELGNSFLRILDECEAGLFPEVQYAGFDVRRYERWHLLYVQDASPRLLDAWNMVERFDHVEELERHGLHVFLSRRSTMLPPVKALLGGGMEDRAIADRIRVMLGNPEDDTLVLIEDLEDDSAAASSFEEGTPSNPRIIHIDRSRATSLTKLLPSLVRDWHNAEPIAALEHSLMPESIAPLREQLESRLLSIAEDENAELAKAAEAARMSLASWANEAANALDTASAPVADAQLLCANLTTSLEAATTTIDDTSAALHQYCKQLTEPRRTWITDQHRQTAAALESSAPRIAEAESARLEAGEAARLLEELSLIHI